MEGAGSFMLGGTEHELGTRGMDTSDEEPELPSAVQDLIRRLEGQPTFVQLRPILIGPELEDFFPADTPLSTDSGWRSKVRLRVLEAIGSCNSFETLVLEYICGDNISRLTASEWEIVLRGFRSSSFLRRIRISQLTWSSEADLESLGVQLGIILNTSSVTELTIDSFRLTARFFLNLASGLRENSHSKLNSLEVDHALGDAKAVKFIVEVLNGYHQLKTLSLFSTRDDDREDDVDEAAVRLLSQALKQNSCLKELVLVGVEGGSAALLLNALAGPDGNRSIERLQLKAMSGIGKCLAEVFISNRSLREVMLWRIDMPVEEWRSLGEAIRDNATATTVNVGGPSYGLEEIACAARSDEKDPVLHLRIFPRDDDETISALNLLGSVLRGEIKSIQFFSLDQSLSFTSAGNRKSTEDILPMNGKTGETSVLSGLELNFKLEDNFKEVWKQLVQCLRVNTSVTSLSLYFPPSNGGLQEEFRDLMSLLQVNLTLKKINVSQTMWGKDGKAVLIEAALEQNQKRAVYMNSFREAGLQLGDAKAGRLFLCGSPKAGKTQLRRTLMKIIQDKTWIRETLKKLSRTRGIEVDFLLNNEKMQISIWDLAGQWIFRTLQNVLFPQTTDFCVFLFVYSPFCEETSFPKSPSCFRTELEGWLTFISSSTKVIGHNLPQVLVVITHKDKMRSTSLNWIHSIVEDLKIRFANYVDLRPLHDFLYVNARERNQVIPLKNHIFEMFKKFFSENSPRVPQLCFQLSSRLLSNIKKDKTCPLWSLEKFSVFCDSSLKQLILPSSVDHPRLLTSLVSYLNDVGSIIYIPNLDHIIVNPNWLTNSVLGELITMGQHFQAQESDAYEKSMSSDSYTSKDGFVSESVFARLMETFLEKQSRFQNVDREVLEKILFNLDLGFKLEDSSQYFIPSFIPEYASMEEQKQQEGTHVVSMSWDSKVTTSKFVGIRIRCEDLKTMSLTAAFFPRFQMFMRRKLESETVTLSRHYMQLLLDCHQIYVEHVQSEKCHNYVDVLMLCSEHKSKEVAVKVKSATIT
ncbi:hypothetical protein MPTK1_3g01450 [Marchantia polymorpha subsp. ruderalis]